MLKERRILKKLLSEKDTRKLSIIVGPRQVGKTCVLKLLYQEICKAQGHKGVFIDADIFSEYESIATYESALNTFRLHGYRGDSPEKFFVFLDEFQRYEDLSIVLKNLYDHHPNVKVYATGSSSLTIKHRIQESLAGRKFLHYLYPLDFEEYLSFIEDDKAIKVLQNVSLLQGKGLDKVIRVLLLRLYEFLQFGGYPEVTLQRNEKDKKEVLKSIFDLFVKKDLVEYLKVKKIRELKEMIIYLAINNGQKIKYENIATLTGFSLKTAKDYLELLSEVFLVQIIRPFFTNKNKELVKIPKVYFLDPGVSNFFTNNFNDPRYRQDGGQLFETFVMSELLKAGLDKEEIKFWQDKARHEVDFIIDKVSFQIAIEVKFKTKLKPMDLRGLKAFQKSYPESKAFLVNLSEQTTNDIRYVLPFSFTCTLFKD
ncbi:MAG: ATP-binding protein [Desulfonauticus sp.]|nr:ATP-binding protein [Desulfonauticus sp.]